MFGCVAGCRRRSLAKGEDGHDGGRRQHRRLDEGMDGGGREVVAYRDEMLMVVAAV